MTHNLSNLLDLFSSLSDDDKTLLRAVLSSDADKAERQVAGQHSAQQPATSWAPRLPELEEDANLIESPEVFTASWYRRYEGVFNTFKIYFAGCDGLKSQSYEINKGTHKIGTTHERNTKDRIAGLSRDRYASMYKSDGHWVEEHHFDCWKGQEMVSRMKLRHNSPALPTQWYILIKMPDGMEKKAFDSALTHELRLCALQTYIDSNEGQNILAMRGLRREKFIRATPPGVDHDEQQFCRELFCLSPKFHTDLIIAAAERIITRFVIHTARKEGLNIS